MINENVENRPCGRGGDCMFQIMGDTLSCSSGDPTCSLASLLEAEESTFHDAVLIQATTEINSILASIPEDENGRNLSFLHTDMGIFLAWVEHGGTPVEDALTADSDAEELAAALKLQSN
jgi:hypothetical protein